jgi:hypothetical protein
VIEVKQEIESRVIIEHYLDMLDISLRVLRERRLNLASDVFG